MKSSPWLTIFGAHDPITTAREVKVPTLVLQGGDDQQVIAAEVVREHVMECRRGDHSQIQVATVAILLGRAAQHAGHPAPPGT